VNPLSTFAPDLFAGQAVLVTGGGRGIGRRTALAFARLGADITIASRNAETLAATAADITALGRRVVSRVASIRDTDDVEAMVADHMAAFGRLDLLVNNAGGQFPARPSEITDKGFRSVVDLNLHGTWNVCSRAVPHMITTRADHGGAGAVVNVVHNQVLERGAVLFMHSGAARAGVVNLTHTMALYLARHRITVNALAPGPVDTEGFNEEEVAKIADARDGDAAAYTAQVVRDTPLGRLQTPDEVAAHILLLCSPAAVSITGQLIVADAGHSMGNQTAVYSPDIEW
jgi:NAD(P)-dependent dehydrogenase (short-subunit alcohol dehydrogenase family)